MKIGDVLEVVPVSGIDEKWWGAFLILEVISTHQISSKTFTMYHFRTHRRSEHTGEELVHTSWVFDNREVKDLLKEVK